MYSIVGFHFISTFNIFENYVFKRIETTKHCFLGLDIQDHFLVIIVESFPTLYQLH
jgi:hypothetical protein